MDDAENILVCMYDAMYKCRGGSEQAGLHELEASRSWVNLKTVKIWILEQL